MTFTVEDGTGLTTATSYVSVADADAYFEQLGVTGWVGTTTDKETALNRASEYMDARFGARYIGLKLTTAQALAWPRYGIPDFDPAVLPANLIRACCQYALRALVAELAPDLVFDESGLSRNVKRQKVGPIEIEYGALQAGLGSKPMLFRPYPAADILLRDLLHTSQQVYR